MTISFHKFHKISNLKSICNKFYYLPNMEWIVTEKIHGCNVSILSDGIDVQFARRNAILSKDEYKNFYNIDILLKKFLDTVSQIYRDMGLTEQIIIYGELFGGGYPNTISSPGTKLIQNGIYYHPEIQFCAFDIRIGDKYLDFNSCVDIFEKYGIFYTKPLYRGSLEDAINWSNNNKYAPSTLPKLLGQIDYISDIINLREGHVLKPVFPYYFPNGDFVIAKDKNDKFSEIIPNSKPRHISHLLPIELQDKIMSCINIQRLNNVISKIGDVMNNPKTMQMVRGLFIQDILQELEIGKKNELYIDVKQFICKNIQNIVIDRLSTT